MFTGLVEATGTITGIDKNKVGINTLLSRELKIGDSVAVNGVCLTVTDIEGDVFLANLSPATCSVTNFLEKKAGDIVNLERAMLLSSRIDGHLVYGHIDTTAKVVDIIKSNDFHTIRIALPSEFKNYVVKKGSIAIDGVSLTIAGESAGFIEIAIIPHTWNNSALRYLYAGSSINIEFDIISKYIEKNLIIYHNKSRINLEFLEENGFA